MSTLFSNEAEASDPSTYQEKNLNAAVPNLGSSKLIDTLLDGKDLSTRISPNELLKIRIPYDGTKKGFLMIDDIAERLHIPTCVTDKSKR